MLNQLKLNSIPTTQKLFLFHTFISPCRRFPCVRLSEMSSEIVPILEGSESAHADTRKESNAIRSIAEWGFMYATRNPEPEIEVDLTEMSSEIVPVLEGSESAHADTRKESKAIGSTSIPIEIWCPEPEVKAGLTGGDYITKKFLASEKGHKYVSKLNPTLDFIKGLLEKIKEPSVLLLQGCGHWLLQSDFPFEKFKTLTALEISHGSNNNHLTTIPENTISEMTQLQSLNLSHLLINQLPSHFFHKLTNLCSLVLRGCSELRSLPSTAKLYKLEVLDLSHCASLQELESRELKHCHLRILNLSYTALHDLPRTGFLPSLTHLLLRDVKLRETIHLNRLRIGCLKVIDLSGVGIVRHSGSYFFRFPQSELLAADLSRNPVTSLSFSRRNYGIRFLILQECTQLKDISVFWLRKLEVLDLSGCETLVDLPEHLSDLGNLKELNLSGCSCLRNLSEGFFNQMSHLEILDLSKTNFDHLPSFANLISLQTLNLSHTPLEEVPDLSSLINLKELLLTNCQNLKAFPNFQILPNLQKLDIDLPQNDRIDSVRVHSSGMENLQQFAGWEDNIHPTHLQGDISKPPEFHLVSTFITNSGFDRFRNKVIELDHLMANIQKKFKPSTTNSNTTSCSTDDFLGPTVKAYYTLSPEFKRQFESMRCDLEYISKSTDLLESSRNCKSSEELLNELVDMHSRYNFPRGSTDLKELLRIVAKLKLLVPPKQVLGFEKNDETKIAKRKKPQFITCEHTENNVNEIDMNMPKKQELLDSFQFLTSIQREHTENNVNEIDMNMPKKQELLDSFQSLTSIQRDCLLYFAVLPCSGGFATVKDRILIHLWFGEGLFESREEHTAIEDVGRKILKVLGEKGFVGTWRQKKGLKLVAMKSSVHHFVTAQAKEKCFFDFSHRNGRLTPHLMGSQRACLLKSQHESSCNLWEKYCTGSSEKLETFKIIRTLLNVDDPLIDIKVGWFSKMSNLSVLHLGSLDTESQKRNLVDVMDLKFLAELQNMKQLRVVSLEGFPAITRLPDSICKVTNLKILHLRDCSNLEELPSDIGSLKNLTHLDLTQCHCLSRLPKGLRLLYKLEVLNGFVITSQFSGRQHEACNVRDLLALQRLRKLSIVVSKDKFPSSNDLHVLNNLKNLFNLQITWKRDPHNIIEQEELRPSKWQRLRCWKQQTHGSEAVESLGGNSLSKIEKLVLCCFPSEDAPSWLRPSELPELKKLYILGGQLKTLPRENWSLETLRLRYLHNFKIQTLNGVFPHETRFEISECSHSPDFYGQGNDLLNF